MGAGEACVAPLPHRGDVTGGRNREEEKQDRMADVRAPLGGDRGEGGKQAGGFSGPTGQMGWRFEQAGRERRRTFGGLLIWFKAQAKKEAFPNILQTINSYNSNLDFRIQIRITLKQNPNRFQ
jgi:hypothetical protein